VTARARLIGALASLALALGAVPAAEAQSPGLSPPEANDFECEPSGGKRPVVLVHGTFLDMASDWGLVSPALAAQGYCVFAFDYGNRGTRAMQKSAAELRAFVKRVLEATGARKVELIGHSQGGGPMPRYYLKFLGGHRRVSDMIGIAPSNHGTTMPLAPLVGDIACAACKQQVAGSRFLRRLNAGDETPGSVLYTTISTRYDEVVTPVSSQALRGRRTTNVVLQDLCPADVFEHVTISYDPVVLQWIESALGRHGPAAQGFQPVCV
jgi:triacylglycerol lipase